MSNAASSTVFKKGHKVWIIRDTDVESGTVTSVSDEGVASEVGIRGMERHRRRSARKHFQDGEGGLRGSGNSPPAEGRLSVESSRR